MTKAYLLGFELRAFRDDPPLCSHAKPRPENPTLHPTPKMPYMQKRQLVLTPEPQSKENPLPLSPKPDMQVQS